MKRIQNITILFMTTLIPGVAPLLKSQPSVTRDTIRIKEIIISSRPVSSASPGFKSVSFDTALLLANNPASLTELLKLNPHIYIKSYGGGGSATCSVRGAGSSHTIVAWNGINISSPMLGQTDFSLITPGMIDNVRISFGGAYDTDGSSGIGGIINLENKPAWNKGTKVSINPGAGSFGEYGSLASVQSGNNTFQSVTKAYYGHSENDFPFINRVIAAEPVREIRNHNQFTRRDLFQEFYYRKNKDIVSARFWYQSADRNLPGSMLIQSANNRENQTDESFRSMLGYEGEHENTYYFIRGAWIFNRLNYFNPDAAIESLNSSNSLTLRGGLEKKILKGTLLKIILSEEISFISSNNYKGKASGNIASLTLMAERKSGNILGTSMMIRQMIDNTRLMIPDFSAGAEIRIFPGADHFLRSGIAKSSRIPSMNERYWVPGGNPELKNEYAYLIDFGYRMEHGFSSSLTLNSDAGIYSTHIRDMIQWHPGEYSYWTADNLKKVNTSGIETSFSLEYKGQVIRMKAGAGYTYTRAVTADNMTDEKYQIVYIPENQADFSVMTEFVNFYALWLTTFTGKRYTVTDNTDCLPGFSVSSLVCGARLQVNRNHFDLNFRTENLFNSEYQAVAYYPQPGRSYHLSFLYRFNNLK